MPKGIYEGNKGKRLSDETKRKLSIAHLGKKNPKVIGKKNGKWKGNEAGYIPKHRYINRNKPKPIDGKCQKCGKVKKLDAACVTGDYNVEDFSNWEYLCRSCNLILDNAAKKGWKTRRDR